MHLQHAARGCSIPPVSSRSPRACHVSPKGKDYISTHQACLRKATVARVTSEDKSTCWFLFFTCYRDCSAGKNTHSQHLLLVGQRMHRKRRQRVSSMITFQKHTHMTVDILFTSFFVDIAFVSTVNCAVACICKRRATKGEKRKPMCDKHARNVL